jgi:hypothetical protein
MTNEQADLLSENGISWIRGDVSLNKSSSWYNVYQLAKNHNLSLIGTLDHITMNQQNFTLADWQQAVNASVEAYGDVVNVWEIWNEPFAENFFGGYFNGTAQTYFDLLTTAHDIIKAHNENATILGLGGMTLYSSIEGPKTGPYVGVTYLQASLDLTTKLCALGAMNYCDAISLHAYPYGHFNSSLAEQFWRLTLPYYQSLTGKEVWITETGQESYHYNTTFTEQEQADYLSASHSVLESLGVKAYIWYELTDGGPDDRFGLYNNDLTPKLALAKYCQIV